MKTVDLKLKPYYLLCSRMRRGEKKIYTFTTIFSKHQLTLQCNTIWNTESKFLSFLWDEGGRLVHSHWIPCSYTLFLSCLSCFLASHPVLSCLYSSVLCDKIQNVVASFLASQKFSQSSHEVKRQGQTAINWFTLIQSNVYIHYASHQVLLFIEQWALSKHRNFNFLASQISQEPEIKTKLIYFHLPDVLSCL